MSKIVSFVENSKNEKIGEVAATYVSIEASCPDTCALKGEGCYASMGNVGVHVRRLDKVAKETNSSDVEAATQERDAIIASFKGKNIPYGKPLRLHVSGDCKTKKAVKILNEGIDNYVKRGGKVWTYTHAWKAVKRSDWSNNVSVLASIDKPSDVNLARKKGYAPAIVVAEFPDSDKAFTLMDSGSTKFIPCPNQTKSDVTCLDCKLCMTADKLFERNMGIAFQSHGVQKNKINKRLLNVIK